MVELSPSLTVGKGKVCILEQKSRGRFKSQKKFYASTRKEENPITIVALSHDGSSVIINKDGSCYVYDIMEEKELFSFTWERYSSLEIVFLYSGFVSVYDMKGRVTRFMPRGTRNTYVSLTYSKDGHRLAAGSIDGRIVIWDTVNDDEI